MDGSRFPTSRGSVSSYPKPASPNIRSVARTRWHACSTKMDQWPSGKDARTNMKMFRALSFALGFAVATVAQVKTEVPAVVAGAKPVTVEHIKVHGAFLEGNLEGDDVDREVIVFLPPDYGKDKNRRYPVVYALHGYSIG